MQVYERILPCDLSFVNILLSKNDISEFRPWHLNLLILIPGKRSHGCRCGIASGQEDRHVKARGSNFFSPAPCNGCAPFSPPRYQCRYRKWYRRPMTTKPTQMEAELIFTTYSTSMHN